MEQFVEIDFPRFGIFFCLMQRYCAHRDCGVAEDLRDPPPHRQRGQVLGIQRHHDGITRSDLHLRRIDPEKP